MRVSSSESHDSGHDRKGELCAYILKKAKWLSWCKSPARSRRWASCEYLVTAARGVNADCQTPFNSTLSLAFHDFNDLGEGFSVCFTQWIVSFHLQEKRRGVDGYNGASSPDLFPHFDEVSTRWDQPQPCKRSLTCEFSCSGLEDLNTRGSAQSTWIHLSVQFTLS